MLEGLNPQQLQAAQHNQGPLLVVAGPGSGKTRTIVARTSYLINNGSDPQKILLMTFTRKAAQEMLLRISKNVKNSHIICGTFHSVAIKFIRQYAQIIGIENFTILDQQDVQDALYRSAILCGYELGKKRSKEESTFPCKETVANVLNDMRSKGYTIERSILVNCPEYIHLTKIFEAIFAAYESLKKEKNYLDFDGILENFVILLQHNVIGDIIRQSFEYIMIDEYQDTNPIQLQIVKELAGKNKEPNIMVVGDDSQSIYGFRGADFGNILTFENIFENVKIIKLEDNYRSYETIVNATNAIISDMDQKIDKTLRSVKGSKDDYVKMIKCGTQENQAEYIATEIEKITKQEEKTSYSDFGILFRSSYLMGQLQIFLKRKNIPFRILGGMKLSEKSHIKDFISFVRIMVNFSDELAMSRILCLHEGIGSRTAEKILKNMSKNIDKQYLLMYFQQIKESKKLKEFVTFLHDVFNTENHITILKYIQNYYLPIMREKYDNPEIRRRDIEDIVSFSEKTKDLSEFIELFILDEPDKNVENGITLSTMHSAKGLEWEYVYLCDIVETIIPHKSCQTDNEIEEEKRLFFVAVSRAKKGLTIFIPKYINMFNNGMLQAEPSRFVQENKKLFKLLS